MSIKHYQNDSPAYSLNTFPLLYAAVILMLGYSVFLVIHSVVNGVNQTRTLNQKQAEIDQLSLQVAVQQRFLLYQKTPSYVEKQAREHFDYIKPGETVVDVPQNTDQSQQLQQLANEQAGITAQEQEKVVSPHLQQWWDYFFGK